MRNYSIFKDKIDVSRAISAIKDLTCLVRNSFKASMKNDMLDFNMIKFLVLILVLVKLFVFFLLDGSSLHQVGLKLTLMGLVTCRGIFHGSMGEFISAFSVFLEV